MTDTDQPSPIGSPLCPCSPVTFSECFELWRGRWDGCHFLSLSLSLSLSNFFSFFRTFLYFPSLSFSFCLPISVPLVLGSNVSRASSSASERFLCFFLFFLFFRKGTRRSTLLQCRRQKLDCAAAVTTSRDRRAGFPLDVRLNGCSQLPLSVVHFIRQYTRVTFACIHISISTSHTQTYTHVEHVLILRSQTASCFWFSWLFDVS